LRPHALRSASASPSLAIFALLPRLPALFAAGIVGAIGGSVAVAMVLPAASIGGFRDDPDQEALEALTPWFSWLMAA